jgi:hypothetical protein
MVPGISPRTPYSQVFSPHGIPVDDLVAVLQKEIRRGRVDNAVLAAYEMFTTSTDVAQHLWRRLRVIAVEDVGMGLPLGPVLIDVLHRNFNATPGGEWMMACHAVRLLASAPKDRTSSEHADWVAVKVALGEALVEVPDYAHCVHTRAGAGAGARSDAVVAQRRSSARRAARSGSPVPGGADRDPSPRRSRERDRTPSIPLGKPHGRRSWLIGASSSKLPRVGSS